MHYESWINRPRIEINTIWKPLIKKETETMVESAKIHSKDSAAAIRKEKHWQRRSSMTVAA